MNYFSTTLMTAMSFTVFSFTAFANPEQTADLMKQWIQLQSQTGKIHNKWAQQRALLEQKSNLLNKEEESLRALLTQAKSNTSDVDKERMRLTQVQSDYEQQDSAVVMMVDQGLSYLSAIQPSLPPPVQTQWQAKLTILSDTELNTNERLERYLSLLNIAYEFNERIALNVQAMEIPTPDGNKLILVNQIYLGLSQAWYISNDGDHYGFGTVVQGEWQWFHGQQAAQYIQQPLDKNALLQLSTILTNPTDAQFVSAPIVLSNNKGVL